MDYKNAGVDIEAGYRSVELMKKHVKETMRPEVLGGLGGFSGAFSMSAFKDMEKPTLVSGTDGVGTKLKLAFILDKHNTVGIDCVAMCVNDIACAGGEPLFFLDYIACGKNYPGLYEYDKEMEKFHCYVKEKIQKIFAEHEWVGTYPSYMIKVEPNFVEVSNVYKRQYTYLNEKAKFIYFDFVESVVDGELCVTPVEAPSTVTSLA